MWPWVAGQVAANIAEYIFALFSSVISPHRIDMNVS